MIPRKTPRNSKHRESLAFIAKYLPHNVVIKLIFFRVGADALSLAGGEAFSAAQSDGRAPQPNSNAKTLAQDAPGERVGDGHERRQVSEAKGTGGDSVVKTETERQESNYVNNTSPSDNPNAMYTGVVVKKEEETRIGSNQESNKEADPYNFSDHDSPPGDEDEMGRVSSNNLDVKMEKENDEADIIDEEHEDFDVADITYDFSQIN